MSTARQQERRQRVEAAAYLLLQTIGYRSTSLLAVAQQASVSNETLYRWYGNKQGLFRSLVEANARASREILETALEGAAGTAQALERLGPVLLAMLTGERAVALNRAAAGDVDDTRTLGLEIAQAGRDTIAPLLVRLVQQAQSAGTIAPGDPAEAAETYLNLLIGDWQIRRVIGAVPAPSVEVIRQRADRALAGFLVLHANPGATRPHD